MRDYADIISQIRIAAIGVKKQSNRLTLMQDAADAIEELLSKVPHWISVEERLPEFVMNDSGCICTKKLLFRTEYKTIHLGYAVRSYHNIETAERFEQIVVDRWYDQSGDMIEDVTHWMPLPAPPKEV